ncbi:pilus assembly protein TadG-related protein [Bacillus timonensis]|nr:pilus assembly protein TadG-related protein [Bacillus timonensis]
MKEMIRNEKGNAIILVSLALMGLLAMAGLVIDGGMVYMTKSHLQKVANSAVLSGAQELTNKEEEVNRVVTKILSSHQEQASLIETKITMGKKVEVDLKKPVRLAFSKLFGIENVDVYAHAAAELGVMGRATGAAPLGIEDSIQLEYFKEYKLKVDSSGVEHGNFGVLALGGPGASTYEDNLRYGYRDEIKVGDIIDTQTGNIAGKTRLAVKERVDGCQHTESSMFDRNCSRVILIPVYKAYNQTSNQMKQILVTGFAYFYITDPMNSKDTSITGMFIKRTGTGFTEPGSVDRGAFSIRLTE